MLLSRPIRLQDIDVLMRLRVLQRDHDLLMHVTALVNQEAAECLMMEFGRPQQLEDGESKQQ